MTIIKYVNSKYLDDNERAELGIESPEGLFMVEIDDRGNKVSKPMKKGVVEFEIGE